VVNAANPHLIPMTAYLMVGTPELPAHNIHGLALSIDYDEQLVVPGSMQFTPLPSSFLCAANPTLAIHKETEDGFLDVALSRTDGQNVQGLGAVARVDFTIIGDIVVNSHPDEVEIPFGMEIHQVQGINALGGPSSTSPRFNETILHVDRSSSLKPEAFAEHIKMIPNPARSELNIDFGTINAKKINIFSIDGQLLISKQPQTGINSIPVNHLPEGVYLLQVESVNNTTTKRFVITR
jgi:hypothetical protein